MEGCEKNCSPLDFIDTACVYKKPFSISCFLILMLTICWCLFLHNTGWKRGSLRSWELFGREVARTRGQDRHWLREFSNIWLLLLQTFVFVIIINIWTNMQVRILLTCTRKWQFFGATLFEAAAKTDGNAIIVIIVIITKFTIAAPQLASLSIVNNWRFWAVDCNQWGGDQPVEPPQHAGPTL